MALYFIMEIFIWVCVILLIIGSLFWLFNEHNKDTFILYSNELRKIESDYKEVKESYSKSLQDWENLLKQCNEKENDIKSLDEKIADKNEIYQTTIERNLQLENLYANKQEELDKELLQYRKNIDDQKIVIDNDLKKIESLVKSLNKTYILESQKQDELNKNRLDIKSEEINDVLLLQNIRNKFSNPRVINKLIWQTYYQPIAKTKFLSILDNKNVTGIYKITNIKDNKVYIGQAVNYNRPMKNFSY